MFFVVCIFCLDKFFRLDPESDEAKIDNGQWPFKRIYTKIDIVSGHPDQTEEKKANCK